MLTFIGRGENILYESNGMHLVLLFVHSETNQKSKYMMMVVPEVEIWAVKCMVIAAAGNTSLPSGVPLRDGSPELLAV